MKRVVITGAGTVNPLGLSVSQTTTALRAGACAIAPLDIRGIERLTNRTGAAVRDFRPEDHLSREEISQCDRFTQFALVAAREAMAQSGLAAGTDKAERIGVILGTAGGGMETTDDAYWHLYERQATRLSPLSVPRMMHNAASSRISAVFGLHGPTFSVSSACASSNHALGLAFQLIRSGCAPAMLAGGAEALLTVGALKAWEGLRVVSPDLCRPFCATRNGMVIGEGAALFVLEELEHAQHRAAPILAEVAGFAMGSDAGHLVAPSVAGAARTIGEALRDAALHPEDVGYINAHGTGTRLNDRVECDAIRLVFGTSAKRVAVSSTKSMHGHLIGAAGAVELLACLLALQEGLIAPTVNFQTPDPECDLDIVVNSALQRPVQSALSNAMAFGGLNAVLALRKAE